LCGVNHSFMPIAVKVVPNWDFESWYMSKLNAKA
jgi:heme/copper-type cytochrome/quinol oxidase subunit 2